MADSTSPGKGGFLKSLLSSMGLKLIVIVILVLLFLIPVALLRNLVNERAGRQEEVRNEIVGQWGGDGQLAGPFLVVSYDYPVEVYNEVKKANQTEWRGDFYVLLPGNYSVDGEMRVEERKRGIFSVPVYTAELGIAGDFDTGEVFDFLGKRGYRPTGAEIVLSLGNNRGIGALSDCDFGGKAYPFRAGNSAVQLHSGSVSAPVPLESLSGTVPFTLALNLKAGRELIFLPVGKESRITLKSDWPAPSFTGAFLPEKRSYGAEGFTAEWRINHISRNSPGAFPSEGLTASNGYSLLEGAFGVRLFQAVDHYTKNERAVKYGILFVLIPFVTFFLIEIIARKRVHPFQYLLSGAANVIFYLLLLSLSEHIGFNPAYFTASAAVTVTMTLYAISVLGDLKKGLILLPVQVCSWVYLYFALLSEDYALLIGSTGLFLILVLVMLVTRRVRWYAD